MGKTGNWTKLLFVLGSLLLPALAQAQSVRGQVFLPTGEAIGKLLQLRVESDDMARPPDFVTTDSQGRFVIERLSRNRYYTIVVDGDKQSFGTTRVRFNPVQDPVVAVHLNPLENSPTGAKNEISVTPDSQDAYLRGMQAIDKNNKVEARKNFEKAIRLDANHALAYNELAVLLMGEKDYAGAEKLLRKGMAKAPSEPHIRHNLGLALNGTGKFADAVLMFREALKTNPGWLSTQAELGVALLESGDAQAAQPCLEHGIRADGIDQVRALLFLGKLHAEGGDAVSALAAWEQYLKLDPDSPNATQVRGAMEQLRQVVPPGPVALKTVDRPCQ